MPLKLTLKSNERLIIGGAVVKNGDSRAELHIENKVPILRDADILSPAAVNTPCERIYLAVQLMYVDSDNVEQHRRHYDKLVQEVLRAAPSTWPLVGAINDQVTAGNHYRALKSAKVLLHYEKELLDRGTTERT
jgi:flagellar protein FlbT